MPNGATCERRDPDLDDPRSLDVDRSARSVLFVSAERCNDMRSMRYIDLLRLPPGASSTNRVVHTSARSLSKKSGNALPWGKSIFVENPPVPVLWNPPSPRFAALRFPQSAWSTLRLPLVIVIRLAATTATGDRSSDRKERSSLARGIPADEIPTRRSSSRLYMGSDRWVDNRQHRLAHCFFATLHRST